MTQEKTLSLEQQFDAWKKRIQKMIDDEKSAGTSVSLQGINVNELTKKDFQYFRLWESKSVTVVLDNWTAIIPHDNASSLKLNNWCRQQQAKQKLQS